jgi:hypothetical protein
VIKGTKLDFYSVASPSPFAHRQITWIPVNFELLSFQNSEKTKTQKTKTRTENELNNSIPAHPHPSDPASSNGNPPDIYK